MDSPQNTIWIPDLLYTQGRFETDCALVCDAQGRVVDVTRAVDRVAGRVVRLRGRALLPGMVNAHSHAFQRVIRGRTEHRSRASSDSFWTWREMMYAAASRLTPEDIYDASRMAFMEMALSGITSVGEFHYIHRTPEGDLYDDPNLLAKEVVRAARDAGLRIALLRTAYARSGFRTAPNERQRRFIEPVAARFIHHTESLKDDLAKDSALRGETGDVAVASAWVGIAPHSTRAVPLDYLREICSFARAQALPVHIHIAEQPAELAACVDEYGLTPVALLAEHGLIDARTTAVHAVHVTNEEIDALARAGAMVCACPTTERNLGDGIVPADEMFERGVRIALGTDSHVEIDLLEDARALEYNLRLKRLERNVLAPRAETMRDEEEAQLSSLAARLFKCATTDGARSIGAPSGEITQGAAADFFTVDLDDPSIAGASTKDLLPMIVFSLARTAIKEVAVGGRLIVEDARHHAQKEVVERFSDLQRRLWQ